MSNQRTTFLEKASFVKRSDILTAFLLDNVDEAGELVRSLAEGSIVELKVDRISIFQSGKSWTITPGNVIMIDCSGYVKYTCKSHEEFKEEYSDITSVIKPQRPATTEAKHPVKPSYEELIALIDHLTIEYHKTLNRKPSARYVPRMYRATFNRLYPKA